MNKKKYLNCIKIINCAIIDDGLKKVIEDWLNKEVFIINFY